MRPSPGVSISSASAATGSSPRTSGRPRTRLAKRPKRGSRGPSGPELRCAAAASGKSTPPGRSRLPVSTLSTSTSHDASVPNSCVQVPMRPYTAAAGAAASSAARARMASAGTPQAGATRSGVNGRSACVELRQAHDVVGQVRREGHAAVQQHLRNAREQQRVGARAHRQVHVGQLGGARRARVHDHQPAAAALQRPQAARQVGRRPQRAVGRHRVRAEDHEQVGAVDVRDRHA